MKYEDQQPAVDAAIAQFPEFFTLAHFPAGVFQISRAASFVDTDDRIWLYCYLLRDDGSWDAFARATVPELRDNLRPLTAEQLRAARLRSLKDGPGSDRAAEVTR